MLELERAVLTVCPCCGRQMLKKKGPLEPKLPMSLWNPDGPTLDTSNPVDIWLRTERSNGQNEETKGPRA